MKNPAKSLNATINLEQMLNGSKSNRTLIQGASGQRSSMHYHDSGATGSASAAATTDVDPVQISSLLNQDGVSPAKVPIGAQPINP